MRLLLLLLTGLIAFTALAGATVLVLAPGGESLRIPGWILNGTPFKDFTIPGVILFFAVGVSHLVATFTLMHRHRYATSFCIAAGALLCSWVIGQMIFTGYSFPLQYFFLAAGLLVILISFQLKGKSLI